MARSLLAIVTVGGYPNLSPLYERCGFDAVVAYSDRKAFSLCRKLKPDVVVTEFKYGPTYGSRVSNMESLIAVLQINCPDTKMIVLFDKEDHAHLQRQTQNFPVFAALAFPLNQEELENTLSPLAGIS